MRIDFSMNTAVSGKPSSVRESHVDSPKKIFAGLFYMRDEKDDSLGGDLNLFKFKKKIRLHGRSSDPFYVQQFRTVKYRPNTLVFFVNSPRSLHGVSQRFPTKHARRFLYLSGTMSQPIYDIEQFRENRLEILTRRLIQLSSSTI